MTQTTAQRSKAMRDRFKEQGFVAKLVWVKADQVDRLNSFVECVLDRPELEQPANARTGH